MELMALSFLPFDAVKNNHCRYERYHGKDCYGDNDRDEV
jgi:hypothetical protein